MLFRKKPTLTTEAYARWLRAQQPPLGMFLAMSDVEQEAFAQVGDLHEQDRALMIGYAVHNPEESEDSRDARAGDGVAEESLARQLAAGLARRLQKAKPPEPPPVPKRETMAGLGSRVRESEEQSKQRLFGRPADTPEEVVAP